MVCKRSTVQLLSAANGIISWHYAYLFIGTIMLAIIRIQGMQRLVRRTLNVVFTIVLLPSIIICLATSPMLCQRPRHLGIQLVNIQPSSLIVLYVTVPVYKRVYVRNLNRKILRLGRNKTSILEVGCIGMLLLHLMVRLLAIDPDEYCKFSPHLLS